MNLDFRPLETTDLPLLAEWMQQDHWREWWGAPARELAHIRNMLLGRDSTRPFLFLRDGEPTGFLQYWFLCIAQGGAEAKARPWLKAIPPGAVGIDLAIGPATLLGQGIGTVALRAFVRELHAQGIANIIVDPDPRNLRAIRSFEKAGFRPVADLLGKTDPLIMKFEGFAP